MRARLGEAVYGGVDDAKAAPVLVVHNTGTTTALFETGVLGQGAAPQ